MPYCRKCGKEVKEEDRFCPNCGQAVKQTVGKQTEGQPDGAQSKNAVSGVGRKKIFLAAGIAAAVIVLAVVAAVAAVGIALNRNHTSYAVYNNGEACFSVDYPEGYMVTEPNSNNVVITEGEEADFQVVVEYAYSTPANCAIYSAEDFAGQIERQPQLLADWLGSDDAEVEDCTRAEIAGRDCYEYDFSLEMDGAPHAGKLYLFDSDGEFGCYSYMSVINENARKAKLYHEQSEAMEQSFKITGAYQAEGYTMYDYDEPGLRFMVRDSAMGEAEKSDDGDAVSVYPVEGVFSEANIWIRETSYEEEGNDASSILENMCDYYFSYKDQAKYLSQPGEMDYGRYPYMGVDMQYYEKGEKYTASILVFVHGGMYWAIEMESTDEYYDAAAAAVSDILFSLKFDGDEPDAGVLERSQAESGQEEADGQEESTGGQEAVSEVLGEIDGSPGYVEDSSWEPLVAAEDFNGDGIWELLAVYEVKDGSGMKMMYEVWSLGKEKPVKLESDVLFEEVGGNSGAAGIVKKDDGKVYLAIEQNNPAGDTFNNYYTYIPWEDDESSLGEEFYYMESHGSYGQEEQGKYILGDTAVDKARFDEKQKEFSDWVYKLDPLAGAGSDGVMTFEGAKK